MAENTSVFMQALIYSCIAFSIVFIVLGGLTLVIYAMRVLTGNSGGSGQGGNSPAGGTAPKAAVQAAPAQAAQASAPTVSQATAAGHIAAITAAILALTNGRGKILSIAPASRAVSSAAGTTRMWRAAAIMESVGRRLAPSWKR